MHIFVRIVLENAQGMLYTLVQEKQLGSQRLDSPSETMAPKGKKVKVDRHYAYKCRYGKSLGK
jgi:hypothetical protein